MSWTSNWYLGGGGETTIVYSLVDARVDTAIDVAEISVAEETYDVNIVQDVATVFEVDDNQLISSAEDITAIEAHQ